MKKNTSFVITAVVATLSLSAAAQFRKPEDAIKYRQSTMFIKQQHFGRIAAMANGRAPFDAKLAAENAEVVLMMASLLLPGYGAGTEGGRAKPEIWKEQARFKELADAGLTEAVKLAAAAKSGNLDSIKTAVTATGDTCKACHDDFRKD